MAMPPTRRKARRTTHNDPDALAARLPNELKTFGAFDSPDDLRSHWTAVADWLNNQAPGAAEQLARPVMAAAGLTSAVWYRQAMQRN